MLGSRLLLLVFSVFLLIGNASRILPFSIGIDGLPVMEAILYACAFLYILTNTNLFRVFAAGLPISCMILASTTYGMFYNQGFDLLSTLYAFRLIVAVYAGHALGTAAYRVFSWRVRDAVAAYCCLQVLVAISGMILLYYFPDSVALWEALGDSGIEFKGDPHKNRLVSVYFDPNFYAVIASLPTLFAFYLFIQSGSFTAVSAFGIILTAIALTFSRSGLATFVLAFGALLTVTTVRSIFSRKMKVHYIVGLGSIGVIAAAVGILNYELAERYLDRFSNVSSDPSAYARVNSLRFGVEVFWESPFFGIGYNYLSRLVLAQRGLSGLDSSVLTLICNAGVIGSGIVVIYMISILIKLYYRIRSSRDPILLSFFEVWIVYISVVVFFSSSFNNIVFYSFWLIQQIAIGVYWNYASLLNEPSASVD